METISSLILQAITGTVLMTLFSYSAAAVLDEVFEEPRLLGTIIAQHYPKWFESEKRIIGWIAHFIIGLTFTVFYEFYWRLAGRGPIFFDIIVLGISSGIAGVAAWHAALSITQNPPRIHRKAFYLQLVVAHLIFVYGVVLVRNLHEVNARHAKEDWKPAVVTAKFSSPLTM